MQLVQNTKPDCEAPDYEELMRMASEAVAPSTPIVQVLDRAERLADMSIRLMRNEQNPSVLASVALMITDPPLQVAYLEAIGKHLL